MKKLSKLIFICLIILTILSAYKTNNKTGSDDIGDSFIKTNSESIKSFTLDNGITVIVKKNPNNRIFSLETVFTGQAVFGSVEKAGLEGITLTMLAHGSQKYNYDELQRILYEKSSSISSSFSNFDLTSFNLVTLDKYFVELFDVYSDALMNPGWDEAEFERVKNDFLVNKQNDLEDPYALASNILNKEFFSGHPYKIESDGSLESLEGITLEDCKKYYNEKISAERMFIVAVGNFDTEKLKTQLNKSLGTFVKKNLTAAKVPTDFNCKTNTILLEKFDQAEGLAEVRGNFKLPAPNDPDTPALQLAGAILDDILFEIVRTRNSACYSVWNRQYAFAANYGNISVYRTNVPYKVKGFIDEALSVITSGKSMPASVKAAAENEESEDSNVFVNLADTLQFYKDQFVSEFYSGQQTNISIANQIAASYYYFGDAKEYLQFMKKINGVTADDIVRVAKTWLADNPKTWIILGSPDLLKQVKKEDFLK